MTDPAPSLKRKRGGQPGNANALRYGLYSKYFTASERQALDNNIDGGFKEELALARIQVGRLAEMLQDYRNMPFAEYIAASTLLNNVLDRIQRLSRAQHYIYQGQSTMEQIMEELSQIPVDED